LERFQPIAGDVQRVGNVVLAEGAADVHDVQLVVLNQQDVQRAAFHGLVHVPFVGVDGVTGPRGQVKANVAPSPGPLLTRTAPPSLSTIFLTSANPTPAPSTLSLAARV